jgi:hypothetical protein
MHEDEHAETAQVIEDAERAHLQHKQWVDEMVRQHGLSALCLDLDTDCAPPANVITVPKGGSVTITVQ